MAAAASVATASPTTSGRVPPRRRSASFVTAASIGGSFDRGGADGLESSSAESKDAIGAAVAVDPPTSSTRSSPTRTAVRGGGGGNVGTTSACPRAARTSRRASSIAFAPSKRSARSMESARITIASISAGTAPRLLLGGGAGSVRIFARTAMGVPAACAGVPVSISKSIAPTDQTSTRASISDSPFACSGAM